MSVSRRQWLQQSLAAAAVPALASLAEAAPERRGDKMAFGLVTYMWGADWDLPTLLGNCEKAGSLGVELRTTHAHGVEPALNATQRAEVQKRFASSPVKLVGLGSNERYDSPNPAELKAAIEATKAFLTLSHDVGSSGVKVKPDRFHPTVPREKTIEQIGKALRELGQFADGLGQQVRLEVHGQCAELPTIKAIIDVAAHDSVAVCWNSNPDDLKGEGLEHNFRLVRPRFGATLHIHELQSESYPYAKLFELLVATDYEGWVLLEAEAKSRPNDRVTALGEQAKLFRKLVADAQAKLRGP